jgi:ubiquinone/menaquinone biosynthesis C-methylase UbiE
VPETEVQCLGDLTELAGKDVIELGCGTAYFSAWLARLGAKVVGIDVTPAQLEFARGLQDAHGLEFPLIEGNAEAVPYPDASFDLALSEYGASIWCDSFKWIPEAARLLRPGGVLVFLRNSTLSTLCVPDKGPITRTITRPLFGMHRIEWDDGEKSVEFHLPLGRLIDLLRENGFEIERVFEIQAPEDAQEPSFEYMNKELGSLIKTTEILFHHEVTNQYLWSRF